MTTPILVTKLYAPPCRPGIVSRQRLVAMLDAGLHRKLSLISAPAGFGKTTLVTSWMAERDLPVAWLSVDEADNDLARFLSYLLAALQRVDPSIGAGVQGVLDLPQPPPAESILIAVLNDISASGTPFLLVLDDYHAIDAVEIDDAMGFLLDHLPSHAHVVITTREDPRLPLARLRARGEMTELRAADLRFTPDEASTFLHDVMDMAISASDVVALEARTEGWIAGLQLAALSMRGREDISTFIDAFAGDDRYIVDYLVEEVLGREPAPVRDFLLQTSILDRMNGPLCDTVTGRGDSREVLQTLERSNLFVVPLDDKRQWYRYHHLFAEVLSAYLVDERPDQVPALHLRASIWFEQHGDLHAAIHHAFAAKDFARVADLIERSLPAMSRGRQEATLLSWVSALPEEVIRARPVLSVDYAGIVMQATGSLDGVEDRLRDAERWLALATGTGEVPKEMVVANMESFRRLPGQIAIYRAGQAMILGDASETVRYASQALDLLPEHDDSGRGAASGLLGLAYWTRGELEAGYRMYTECMARLRRAGFIADTFGGALVLADIRVTQGRLREAMETYERALQLASVEGAMPLRGMADMHVGMSGIHLEMDDLDEAIHHLQVSADLGEHNGLRQNPYRWRVAMAGIREAEGDLTGALDMLRDAERLYEGDFSPNVRPIPALMSRIRAAHGEWREALVWTQESGLSMQDDLTYLHEFEYVTLARVLLSRARSEHDEHAIREVIPFLNRLLDAAENGGRNGSAIDILAVLALTNELLDDIAGALEPLERALALAEPEGYVRIFVGEGAPMARLLSEASRRGIMPQYTTRLLAAFSADIPVPPLAGSSQPLVDPLSPREREVLHLIAMGLSNHEIGERLYLALSTVKGHNREIFGKLCVQRRTEAVARARDLGLL